MDKPGWRVMQLKKCKDKVSSGLTEDSLVSSRINNETVHSGKNILSKICKSRVRKKYVHYKFVITSILLSIFGVLQIIFPPYDLLMNLRLKMTPGLPSFEWWLEPPDEAIVKIYIFNVTNSERFLNETDKKITLEEIGPIIYREILVHKNIVFNENGTLTYTSNRTLEYLPERNPTLLLNKTIVMPNIAVLFVPSFLYNAPFIVRFGVNLMMRRQQSQLFKTATIEEFLWNMTDPILETSQKILPSMVPTKNVGILTRIYEQYEDNITVYIGPKFEERDFFRIDKYDGSEYMPHLKQCKEKLQGSTDDLFYFQAITKNDTLRFFRKTLCRVADLKYKNEFERYGMTGYRFEMPPNFYNRTFPVEDDCYRGEPILANGLMDVSSCNYDSSIAASYPHFLHGDAELQNSVNGMNPDVEKHTPFVELEPNTGIPFLAAARSQINIVVRDMKGFNERLHKFSNLSIPLMWIDVVQENLPLKVQWMVYIQVVVMPVFQKVLVVSTFLAAFSMLLIFVQRGRGLNRKHSAANKALTFESETFLKS